MGSTPLFGTNPKAASEAGRAHIEHHGTEAEQVTKRGVCDVLLTSSWRFIPYARTESGDLQSVRALPLYRLHGGAGEKVLALPRAMLNAA
jgi:hypothetical protein